jgi:tol-pal system protein YbgF
MSLLRELPLVFTTVVGLGAAGCGAAQHASELSDLKRRLDEAQRREASQQEKVDELENRVFLLTDQVESQKVAQSRRAAPRLPVVTLTPSVAPPAEVEGGEGPSDVEFEGAARSPDSEHARPTLRNDGVEVARARISRPRAEVPPSPRSPSKEDDLGVAAAPLLSAVVASGAPAVKDVVSRDVSPATRERAPVESEPLGLYRAAYQDLTQGRHEDAARRFREFLKRYPHHDYADNAQYWLGECFYDRRRFNEAAAEFRAVVARYPSGNKAPDAMVKLGFCLIALGDTEKAKELLSQVPASYPRTDAARLAEHRLAELKESP